MNKKLLAIAVSGALAAPGVALAQSSVTISGLWKAGFEGVKYGNFAGAGRSNNQGVADDSSRIIFNVVEDLGGGLQAIGQVDVRVKLDDTRAAAAQDVNGFIGQGNTHVGLRSKSWGRLILGRQDLHYFNRESDLTVRGSLRADSISLLAFVSPAGATAAIAGATRTQNVVHYTTPNWAGFTLIAAYSANPTFAAGGQEADLGSAVRKGRAWKLNPNFAGKNFQVGYSYWNAKPDGAAAVDQRSDRLYGSYTWGGFKVGLAWDKSKLKTLAGVQTSNRTAWSIPASYTWGPHSIHGHYTKARNDKATAGDDAAKMFALSYGYDLSKRTSVAVAYAKITNNAAAAYNFFTNTTLGVANIGLAAGEDPKLWAVTLRHTF